MEWYYVRYLTRNAKIKAPEELWWLDVEKPELQAYGLTEY